MFNEVFILDSKRSPIGKYGKSLSVLPITNIAGRVIKELLSPYQQIVKHIDEVVFGNALSAGLGQNPARIAAHNAGLPDKIPAFTINHVCGSGLKSVILGAQSIQLGGLECVLTGGMEGMSRCPYLLENYRFGVGLGNKTIIDSLIIDGLYCSLTSQHMGITAENIAKKFKITRQQQDEYSLHSHKKAILAINKGLFKEEIIPIHTCSVNTIEKDEQPRKDTSIKKLGGLKSAFQKKGTVTAGNSSPLNDGAAAAILVSKKIVSKYLLNPLAIIRSYATVGLNPNYMGLGGYYAALRCLEKVGMKSESIDLWEINEAFASQSIAVINMLGIDQKIVNVNGGVIALGHPIGASGTRILTTLLYELKRRHQRFGVATLCIGGGQGVALLVENVQRNVK